MPYRREIFAEDVYYHIFNRSVASERIFYQKANLTRALELINFYRFPSDISYSHLGNLTASVREMRLRQIMKETPLVEILAFSLMPTHFHFVIKQQINDGIVTFLKKLQGSYGLYYNIRSGRHGAVFSNRFKAVFIESEEQLVHVVRYVELNPVTGHLIQIDDLQDCFYTSFTTYMGKHIHPFVSTEVILNYFKTKENYRDFVFSHAEYQRSLAEIKNLLMD
ncbi:MAG: transposase [Candidatus Paceibacterota bacterium]